MAYIPTIEEHEAQGLLKREYAAAEKRAGRVYNVLKVMSQSPKALQLSMRFYWQLMHEKSPLTRAQREMLGVVVSSLNGCFY